MRILHSVVSRISRIRRRIAWSRNPRAYLAAMGVTCGTGCRIYGIPENVFGSEPYLCRLGNNVSITAGVRFVSHDGGVWVLRNEFPDIDIFGPISVGNNVFIGINSIIMPGVTIGDNVVIGAGSVVTRDVPSGCIAAGNPARVIRSIAEYRDKAIAKGHHWRSLPAEDLRRKLTEYFNL